MSVRSDPLRAWMSAVTAISRTVNAAEPLETVLDDIARWDAIWSGSTTAG